MTLEPNGNRHDVDEADDDDGDCDDGCKRLSFSNYIHGVTKNEMF